jgi:hypothetical protein
MAQAALACGVHELQQVRQPFKRADHPSMRAVHSRHGLDTQLLCHNTATASSSGSRSLRTTQQRMMAGSEKVPWRRELVYSGCAAVAAGAAAAGIAVSERLCAAASVGKLIQAGSTLSLTTRAMSGGSGRGVAVLDLMQATATTNHQPHLSPRPPAAGAHTPRQCRADSLCWDRGRRTPPSSSLARRHRPGCIR